MIQRAIIVFHQSTIDLNFLVVMVLFGTCSAAFGYTLCMLVHRVWRNN